MQGIQVPYTIHEVSYPFSESTMHRLRSQCEVIGRSFLNGCFQSLYPVQRGWRAVLPARGNQEWGAVLWRCPSQHADTAAHGEVWQERLFVAPWARWRVAGVSLLTRLWLSGSMTMICALWSQIILQKSFVVCGRGCWVMMNSLLL